MIPRYITTVCPIPDILAGLDIGEYLSHMERQGAILVTIMPIFSHVLLVHRILVPDEREALGETGQSEDSGGVGDDDHLPDNVTKFSA